ncbi:RNA-directed DNA polymerase, eukaryota, reverse transcriptase zinc-binding domain protein [Tanacetum coccineum]
MKRNNRFSVLGGIIDDDQQEINLLKDKMIVDKYLNLKLQPSSEEIKNRSQEMLKYFKRAWDEDREKEKNDILDGLEGIVEDVLEDESLASRKVKANEMNGSFKLMVINTSRQHILCLIENIHDHKKLYCSFIYASNHGKERRDLWMNLFMAKMCTSGNPWILMGDFNITLNVSEHTVRKSTMDGDMEEFIECVNKIEVEDVCSTGHAHAVFHPFLVSDHSLAMMIMPLAMEKKKKSFKFANFVADKEQYLSIIEKGWEDEIQEAQMEMSKDPFNSDKKVEVTLILKKYNEAVKDEVKLLKSKNRILSINNKAGITVEGKKVADEFVNHFEMFLGHSSSVSSLEEIGEIFTSKLSIEEASFMIREITDNEIKSTMFGINDSKAPGPDGYTACFFKKAWVVIGIDVCKAVKEFFSSGKLLKEANSTFIALIPKVNNACNVTDYRPIACCNVLYKCISKILTTRIKRGLDKVAITEKVEPKDVLSKLILLKPMTLSIGKGRGLRQGDPISPYLFTLVMEVFTLILKNKIQNSNRFKYHAGCKEISLTHLCFTDDLLVMSYGDAQSVKVIKESLDVFSNVSRLKPNMNKSTIFFGNVDIGEMNRILDIVPFQVRRFPMRYLGVPLITKRLGKDECKQLVDKVKAKVGDWKNKFLSYAGRVQLIASVLGFMQVGNEYSQKDKNEAKTGQKPSTGLERAWKNDAKYWLKILRRNGNDVLVWYDNWSEKGPLCQYISSRDIYDARYDQGATVADMLDNGYYKWSSKFPDICIIIAPILSDSKDKVVWKCNNRLSKSFSISQVWEDYSERLPNVAWERLVWFSHDWISLVNTTANRFQNRSIKSISSKIVFGAAVYFVWQERNRRQFSNMKRTMDDLLESIVESKRVDQTPRNSESCKMGLLGPRIDLSRRTRWYSLGCVFPITDAYLRKCRLNDLVGRRDRNVVMKLWSWCILGEDLLDGY